MLHCDLRVRWKIASNLRFQAAISEPAIPSFCGNAGDLATLMRKLLAIAIVRVWCAKLDMHEGLIKTELSAVPLTPDCSQYEVYFCLELIS